MGETVPYISNVLNSYSLKKGGVPVDFKTALQYPLRPLPLNICNSNSSHWHHTTKIKLEEIILTGGTNIEKGSVTLGSDIIMANTTVVMNLTVKVSLTYHMIWLRNLLVLFGKNINKKAVTDIYKNSHGSIKSDERMKRGVSNCMQNS